MTDSITHECGIALVRLLKPMAYYQKKYGTVSYGINKLCLLMEKQHNRGQDGAGVVNIKFDVEPGKRYISRHRAFGSNALAEIFERINLNFADIRRRNPEKIEDTEWVKKHI